VQQRNISLANSSKRPSGRGSPYRKPSQYFAETDWTLPGIREVNAEFERYYDEEEYERRICALGQAIEAELKNVSIEESSKWHGAIEKLSEGDHYLLVLLNPNLVSGHASKRPPGDLFKLWLTALVIVLGIAAAVLLYARLFGSH